MRSMRFRRTLERLGEENAQVSAELIIIIAAVVAVAIILITQLQSTAKKGRTVVENETSKAWQEVQEIR
jgi:hypothetical protein